MRFSIFLMALCFLQSSPVRADGDHTIFELGDFAFESGVTLPNARLSYVTYGALNESKTNVVLLPSWYLTAQEPIRVFAAASLTDALATAIADFHEAHPSSRVVPQFGASSDLARQILAGAPADLFFSADQRQLDRVAAEGLIQKGGRADVLSNELVVVRHREEPDTVDGLADLETFGRIAMADPQIVPAGVYARLFLESQGHWVRLQEKVVPTLDVRGALAAVASGNVEAGFVYRTDAAIEDRVKIVYTVPREEGPRILYSLGIIEGRKRHEVRALYDFLRSEAGGEVFAKFGFVSLGDAEAVSSDHARRTHAGDFTE